MSLQMWESHHPPTQVVKLSSPLGPPWGIPCSLLWQWRHSDTAETASQRIQPGRSCKVKRGRIQNVRHSAVHKWSALFPTYRTVVFELLQDGQVWKPVGGDRLSAFVAPAPWSSSLVWLPLPRHPSTSRLKAWALLSRANLYLQGIRL